MKSIKEKAKEAERNTLPLFETISESDGKPVSVYDKNDMVDMFEQGANYVLEQIEEFLNLYGVYCMSSSAIGYLKGMVEQLKSNQ